MRFSNTNADNPLITRAENSAIAEIEATVSTLQLVSRLTQMRFVSIAKFTESDWVACAVHDAVHFGIELVWCFTSTNENIVYAHLKPTRES
ncbi:GAF-like protein domain protein [Pseudomonas amygdali pv. morsprunorum]|nr:GAF-like protein domain protein [Pseudomonas amygdali pv. morsprunorum]